mmetsp:Transcript_53777/g.149165  ORF Transcript_53777/g.149165 Transcript_53777/m.149165 type:complete len:117 (-) Transcript_53777:499-849(-)
MPGSAYRTCARRLGLAPRTWAMEWARWADRAGARAHARARGRAGDETPGARGVGGSEAAPALPQEDVEAGGLWEVVVGQRHDGVQHAPGVAQHASRGVLLTVIEDLLKNVVGSVHL